MESPVVPPSFSEFTAQSMDNVCTIIQKGASKSRSHDPLRTVLLKEPQVLSVVLQIINTFINQSLSSGMIPSAFKTAQEEDWSGHPNYKNHRPVSNIPFIAKVWEKVVAKQLKQHLQQHGLGDYLHSDYRQGCSTETALLKIKDMDKILDLGQDNCYLLPLTLALSSICSIITS